MISHRIQYELEKQNLSPIEIMLGSWIFEEFIKEREVEDLQKFDNIDNFTFLGIKVTQSNILDPAGIKIYVEDESGINNLTHSLHDFVLATKLFHETASMFSPIAIVTRRNTNESDFKENHLLLNDIPQKHYKPFIKMLKAGFDIKSAITTLKETF